MHILFLDNFRGFSNTYIPIENVNFLVGENSTGKTSFLGVLNLLSSPHFWMNASFNSPPIEFGHFDDIVSVNSPNRNHFSIGFIETVKDKKNSKTDKIGAYLLTFVEKNGSPRVAFYAFYYGSREYRIRFKGNKARYKSIDIPTQENIPSFTSNIFKRWVTAYRNDQNGYRIAPKVDLKKFPLMFIPGLLSALDKKKEEPHKDLTLYQPPSLTHDLIWMAPIRSKPKRTYDDYKLDYSPEGQHTPYLIKRELEGKANASKFERFIKRIGKDSALFEGIKIRKYGHEATAPFELDVLLNEKALSVSNVGYGVSQALPVIVEAFTRPEKSWFAIQQPEVHLHPKAQAALGDILFQLASNDNKNFIIETHSDYMIDRFRLNFKKGGSKSKLKAQILYFERTKKGNRICQLPIMPDGELPQDLPSGYRSFFMNEAARLLGL